MDGGVRANLRDVSSLAARNSVLNSDLTGIDPPATLAPNGAGRFLDVNMACQSHQLKYRLTPNLIANGYAWKCGWKKHMVLVRTRFLGHKFVMRRA